MDDPFASAGPSLYQRGGHHLHDNPAPAGGDLAVSGVHALLFDDDANAAFINSPAALLPWNGDQSLLIDRYDVRHLLQDLSGVRKRRPAPPLVDVTEEELNHERFRDLDEAGQALDDSAQVKDLSKPVANGYGAVQFSYSERRVENGTPAESGNGSLSFYPPFPVPDFLLTKLPSSQKMHQIISGTAKFVSEHGGQSEIVLKVKQGKNPMFGFLNPDHYLHEYYRYLVNNKELTGGVAKERPGSADDGHHPGEGLSLLGSVYGTGDEDDDNEDWRDTGKTSVSEGAVSSESRLPPKETELSTSKASELVGASIKLSSTSKASELVGASIKLSSNSDVQVKKNAKVSLNLRNEKIGVQSTTQGGNVDSLSPEQGKGTLGDAKGPSKNLSQPGKKKIFVEKKEFIQPNKNNVSHLMNVQANHGTGGSSEDPFVTPTSKFHTVSESKTSLVRTSSNTSTDAQRRNKLPVQSSSTGEYGMTADAAAAVVLAATRGVRWAKQGSSNRSSSSGPSQKVSNLSKEASNEGVQASEKAARTALSEVSAATAVAQAAALAAAHEADSADAHLSPAEKLKAERLRRAKIFAAMIKNGENASQFMREPAMQSTCRHSLDNEAVGSGSNLVLSDVPRADKHVPYRDQFELVALKAKGVQNELLNSKEEDSGEGTSYKHHPNKRRMPLSIEVGAGKDYGKSKKLSAKDNEARDYDKKKASQESPSLDVKERDSNEGDMSHSKSRKHDRERHHRSERKEHHRSKRHRSEADDKKSHHKKKSHHRHHKHKHHNDDHSDSEEEDDEKQRHHQHRQQRLSSSSPGGRPSSTKNSTEELQTPALVKQEKVFGSPDDAKAEVGSANSIHESAHTVTAVDVPDDIRAKVRAMLLSNIL